MSDFETTGDADQLAATSDLIYAVRTIAAALGDPRHAEHGATPSIAEALIAIADAIRDHAAAVRQLDADRDRP